MTEPQVASFDVTNIECSIKRYYLGTHIFPDVLFNDITEPDGNSFLLSLKLSVDVLVVSCPCALGLATPTTILVGTSLGKSDAMSVALNNAFPLCTRPFCFDQGEHMLIYEYIPNDTLKDSLSGKSGIRLDWMRRLRIALGAARCVQYLHDLARDRKMSEKMQNLESEIAELKT